MPVDEVRRLTPAAEWVIATLDPALRSRVSTETFVAQIELKTGICSDAAAAATELARLRATVRATGAGLLGAGVHPDDEGEARLVEKPRYEVAAAALAEARPYAVDLTGVPPCAVVLTGAIGG